MKNIKIKGLDENDLGKDSLAELMRIENGKLAKESGQLLEAAINGGKAVINKLNEKNKKTGHWRKLGDSKIGVPRDEETKKKIKEGTAHSWKPILQFSKDGKFLKEWKNFTEIEEKLSKSLKKKINKQPIWSVCNNKPKCKTAYGFVWKYK